MATLDEAFIPNDVPEDDRGFDPIPPGNYNMQVIDSNIIPTKSGSGDQLVLTLEVINGPFENRRVWDRLNIRNQNADAQRIAQRALADLCIAIGISSLTDTNDLHFKPFTGCVTIQNDKTGQYGPQNRVRYKPRNGGSAPARPLQAGNSASSAGLKQQEKAATGAQSVKTSFKPAGQTRPWNKRQDRFDDDVPF
jgi:hypothetical protein